MPPLPIGVCIKNDVKKQPELDRYREQILASSVEQQEQIYPQPDHLRLPLAIQEDLSSLNSQLCLSLTPTRSDHGPLTMVNSACPDLCFNEMAHLEVFGNSMQFAVPKGKVMQMDMDSKVRSSYVPPVLQITDQQPLSDLGAVRGLSLSQQPPNNLGSTETEIYPLGSLNALPLLEVDTTVVKMVDGLSVVDSDIEDLVSRPLSAQHSASYKKSPMPMEIIDSDHMGAADQAQLATGVMQGTAQGIIFNYCDVEPNTKDLSVCAKGECMAETFVHSCITITYLKAYSLTLSLIYHRRTFTYHQPRGKLQTRGRYS